MQEKKRSKADQHAATRTALLATSRRLFAAQGYAGAGTEDVVREAGVTRGALYYHFKDKQALFDAVVQAEAALVLDAIGQASAKAKTPLEALLLGIGGYLDACQQPEIRRIYLLDAPSALGWARWRAIDSENAMGALRQGVTAATAALPTKRRLSAEALTYLLSGALNEAALWLAEAEDEAAARKACDKALNRMLADLFSDE